MSPVEVIAISLFNSNFIIEYPNLLRY